MSRFLVSAGLVLFVLPALAVRHVGFETDAFNRVCPLGYQRNLVFSPASFELDCAIVAESLETIPKANVSEAMGVVLDFESAYQPILEDLSCRTNGLRFTSARGFCVQDLRTARPDHRIHLARAYGAEVMRSSAPRGIESWFRATMDGEMENFELPVGSIGAGRYSYYDLVSVRAAWKDPFPTENTRKMAFHPEGVSNIVAVTFMSDVRVADTWETEEYTLLALPLKGDATFYAMLPKEGFDLTPARADITSVEIDHLLAVLKSVSEKGVSHGPCAIVLPKLDLFSRLDMSAVFLYFRIPVSGLVSVAGSATARELVQYARFRLDEHASDEPALEKKPAEEVVPLTTETKRLFFNRPFLFFVYHEKTATVPIAGQFTGRE